MNSNKIYVFERPKAEIYIANYIDKVGLMIGVITFILDILFLHNITKSSSWFFGFSTLILLSLFFEIFFRRFAHRISVNLDTHEITFSFFRHKKDTIIKIEDIKEIRMNAYITFIFDKRKVFYNDLVNKELVAFIEELRPTTWSRLGRFLYNHW
jgi:hypothetical protein